MIQCVRCGNECKGVVHEVINYETNSLEYLCGKCRWSKEYREKIEEQWQKERIELQEQIIEEYMEWGEGIQ